MTRAKMRALAIALAAAVAPMGAAAATTPPGTSLMPLPRALTPGAGSLALAGPLAPRMSGCVHPIAARGIDRFVLDAQRLAGTTRQGAAVALTVRCRAADPGVLTLEAKEGYRLDVTPAGITVDADGETGVIRALATARQLIRLAGRQAELPVVHVDDAPRFAWRGVAIDTSRHFMRIPTLLRQIDAMESAKLDVLHLILSNNEGFRVESRRLPLLTSVGSHGQYYTQDQIRALVRYAGDRGVRIVPEFDMPSHNYAAIEAYPALAAAPIAPGDPVRQAKAALDPSSPATYRFVRTLINEMAPLFPDRYFHIGGDEVSPAAWSNIPKIAAFMTAHGLKDRARLAGYFQDRIRPMLAAKGKTTVGWDEVADEPLPRDVVVESWRSSNPVSTVTARGNRVIVAAGYYLDHLFPAEHYYAIDPLDPVAFSTMTEAMLTMARKNPQSAAFVSDALVARPLPPLTPDQAQLVLGGEAPLWAEIVSDEMLDGRLWPRALAIGERFWSPATVTDRTDMLRRMVPAMDRLRALGLEDQLHRAAMVRRLAPADPQPALTLVEATAPVRLFAHNHNVGAGATGAQQLIEPADAASTDGSDARRFSIWTADYLAGDKAALMPMRGLLTSWRDNDAAYAATAKGQPVLEAALPTSADLAQLGGVGLDALDTLEAGKPMPAARRADAQALLDRLTKLEAASATLMGGMMKQPAGDLIILPAADVARLVAAAPR